MVDKEIAKMSSKTLEVLEDKYEVVEYLDPLEKQTLEEDLYMLLKRWKPKFDEVRKEVLRTSKQIIELNGETAQLVWDGIRSDYYQEVSKLRIFDNGDMYLNDDLAPTDNLSDSEDQELIDEALERIREFIEEVK
jgi:hypothetical protein